MDTEKISLQHVHHRKRCQLSSTDDRRRFITLNVDNTECVTQSHGFVVDSWDPLYHVASKRIGD